MAPTLFDPSARRAILERLGALAPDAPRRWGTMTAGQAVAHMGDALRFALGELDAEPIGGPASFPPLRHAIIHWLPWPKGRAKAPPEAFSTEPAELGADVAATRELIERVAALPREDAWPAHPIFGALSARDWGVLSWRHLDHHLRQFGT